MENEEDRAAHMDEGQEALLTWSEWMGLLLIGLQQKLFGSEESEEEKAREEEF